MKAPGDEITVGSNIAVTAVWDFDPKVLQSIAVKTNPKTSYQVGEQFDSAGLVVTVTYDYGDPVDIDTGFTLSYSANYEFKADDIGEDKTVTVSYAEGLINVNTTYKIDVYVAAGYYIEYEGDAKAPVKMATENLTDNQKK